MHSAKFLTFCVYYIIFENSHFNFLYVQETILSTYSVYFDRDRMALYIEPFDCLHIMDSTFTVYGFIHFGHYSLL